MGQGRRNPFANARGDKIVMWLFIKILWPLFINIFITFTNNINYHIFTTKLPRCQWIKLVEEQDARPSTLSPAHHKVTTKNTKFITTDMLPYNNAQQCMINTTARFTNLLSWNLEWVFVLNTNHFSVPGREWVQCTCVRVRMCVTKSISFPQAWSNPLLFSFPTFLSPPSYLSLPSLPFLPITSAEIQHSSKTTRGAL